MRNGSGFGPSLLHGFITGHVFSSNSKGGMRHVIHFAGEQKKKLKKYSSFSVFIGEHLFLQERFLFSLQGKINRVYIKSSKVKLFLNFWKGNMSQIILFNYCS